MQTASPRSRFLVSSFSVSFGCAFFLPRPSPDSPFFPFPSPVLSAALRSFVSLSLPCPFPAFFSVSPPSSFSSSFPVSLLLRHCLSVALFLSRSFSLPLCLLALTSAFLRTFWFPSVSRFVSFSLSLSLFLSVFPSVTLSFAHCFCVFVFLSLPLFVSLLICLMPLYFCWFLRP